MSVTSPLNQALQDKDFMAAPDDQKMKYLSSIDSDFAKAPPDQQKAYLSHITGGQKPLGTYSSGQQAKPGDFQRAPNAPIENIHTPAPGAGTDFSSGNYLKQQPGETTDQFMQRGAHAKVTPQNIADENATNKRLTPVALGTALTAGAVSPVGLAAAATSPAATVGALGGGAALGKLSQMGTKALGGGETAQNWASLGGGLAGSLAGGIGADRIVPSRAQIGAKVFTPEGKTTPLGDAIAHPIDKGTEFGLRKLFPPPQPEGVGATEPSAGEFYENKGKDLMRRGTQQATLDRAAARAIPKPAKGVMTIGEQGPQTLSSVARPQVGLPQGESTPFQQPNVRMVSKFEPPEAPPAPAVPPKGTMSLQGGTLSNQPAGELPKLQPINRTIGGATSTGPEAKIVGKVEPPKPGLIVSPDSPAPTVEGSYWSFKEPALRKAVLSGDRHAAIIYQTRFGTMPEGAKYLTDVGSRPTRGLYQNDK